MAEDKDYSAAREASASAGRSTPNSKGKVVEAGIAIGGAVAGSSAGAAAKTAASAGTQAAGQVAPKAITPGVTAARDAAANAGGATPAPPPPNGAGSAVRPTGTPGADPARATNGQAGILDSHDSDAASKAINRREVGNKRPTGENPQAKTDDLDLAEKRDKTPAQERAERAKESARDLADAEGKTDKGDTWKDWAKDARSAVVDNRSARNTFDPTDDDDRTRATRMRDDLRDNAGVDADKVAGVGAGAVAGIATAATGAGAAVAVPVTAAGAALGEGISRGVHSASTKFVGARKRATIAIGSILALGFFVTTGMIPATQAQQEEQEQAMTIAAATAHQEAELNAANLSCGMPQESLTESGFGTAEHLANVAIIVSVGQEMNVPEYGIVIAVATAMQESGLVNLSGGDRDSVGLFQQRPSMGWGSVQEIMDPEYSSGRFYSALLSVDGWERMSLTEAAQAVQRSGHPNAYAKHETAARQLISMATGLSFSSGCEPQGTPISCDPVEELELAHLLYTPDSRSLLRCLWHMRGARGIEVSSSGRFLKVPVTANTWNVESILDGTEDAMGTSDTANSRETIRWLVAVREAFGIKKISFGSSSVTFDSEGQPVLHDISSADIEILTGESSGDTSRLPVILIEVYGSAGTGVVTNSGWVIPTDTWYVTSNYGIRKHPIFGDYRLHAGVDLRAPAGANLYAVSSGVVETYYTSGGGNTVSIDHGDGIVTKYLHLSRFDVADGVTVQAGQLIGRSGSTGNSTAPHLHFEVHIGGSATNPVTFLSNVGAVDCDVVVCVR